MKKYTLKVYKSNKKVEIIRTKKKKSFLKNLRMIDWQNGIKKAYLKVSYGKKVCNFGCLCKFWNDGYYHSKEELTTTGYLSFDEPVDILMTSGASCPDAIVENVIRKLASFYHSEERIEELIMKFNQ